MPATPLHDIASLAVFARVVETRSFTAAAAALGVSKAAVSQRITALEKRCATALLVRTTRRLSLTPEGEALHASCAGLIAAADAAGALLGRVGREPQGEIRVTAPSGTGGALIVDALPSFCARHPAITVDLEVTNRAVDLVGEGFDMALRFAERLADSSLPSRRVGRERMVVCGAPAYLAARGAPRHVLDLRDHACLRLAAPRREWRFRDGGEEIIVPAAGPLRANDTRVLRDAAVAGLGLAVLPESLVADDLDAGRLQLVLPGAIREGQYFALFPSRQIPAKVRLFVEHLAARLKARRTPRAA